MDALTDNKPFRGKDSMAEAWQLFREQGIIAEWVRPVVARSWQRSREAEPKSFQKILSRSNLRARQERHKDLITIARPVMQEICRIAGKNYIEFHDQDGYSLEGFGNSIFPPAIGFNCSEGAIGTSSIGIALFEGLPIAVDGYEHYASWLHSYSCVAAPVHDPQGKIIAVINITNPFGGLPEWVYHVLCLGVKHIESQYIKSEEERTSQLREAFASIVSLFEARQDNDGKSRTTSKHKLELHPFSKREDLVGKNVGDLAFPKASLSEGEEITPPTLVKKDLSANPNKNSQLASIDGVHPIWADIKNTLLKSVDYKPNILIEGETGTGKEVIARIIHTLSGRKGHFVPINCGAIPQELIQSELFGYEEGAFTGAKKGGNIGKFALADQGTLFLDEIGEMPLAMQTNLLRFLQDKTIAPIGSNTIKQIDLQIIAATNRNLSAEIKLGNFRADLYYRLNVVNIRIPPLRERKEDISWLVGNLLKTLQEEYQRQISLSEEAIGVLMAYDWPGNVRELRNILELSLIQNDGKLRIEEMDMHKIMLENSVAQLRRGSRFSEESSRSTKVLKLKDYEKILINNALEICGGNISAAAKILGISRVTLYKKLQTYNLG